MDILAPRAHVRLSLPAGLTRHLEFAADIYGEGLDSIAGFLQRFSAAAAEEGKCQRITTLATRRVETSDHWTEYTAAARQLRLRCTQRSARFFGLLRAPPRAVALVSQPNRPLRLALAGVHTILPRVLLTRAHCSCAQGVAAA